MGSQVGLHGGVAPGVPLHGDRFGTMLAAWELDDPNITQTAGRVTTLPNRMNPGTHDLIEVGVDGPTYEAAGWNGAPSMLFNGTDEFMTADSAAASFSGDDKPITIIMAMQAVSRTVGDTAVSLGNSADNNPRGADVFDDGTNWDCLRRDDAASALTVHGRVGTSTNRFMFAQSFTGTTLSTHYDGVIDANAAGYDFGVATLDQFTIGCLRRVANCNFANIRISAIWLYTNALSDAATVAASKAMARRWTWV